MSYDKNIEINQKLDQILALLQPEEIKDNWRDWASVMNGCSYNGGTLEAEYTEQNKWRIRYSKDGIPNAFYVPEFITAETINVWWAENQNDFMRDALASIEAYKEVL